MKERLFDTAEKREGGLVGQNSIRPISRRGLDPDRIRRSSQRGSMNLATVQLTFLTTQFNGLDLAGDLGPLVGPANALHLPEQV